MSRNQPALFDLLYKIKEYTRNTCMQQPLASKIEDATIFLEHAVLL